jgi:hypothetical protein
MRRRVIIDRTPVRVTLVSLVLIISVLVSSVVAQLATIPQQLARAGHSLASSASVPSGVPPAMDQVLSVTDLLVRGVVGPPESYLSDDQMDVYTDYPIADPVVLYEAPAVESKTAAVQTVTVTLLGGVITIDGLSFTSKHQALPLLQVSTECMFLLRKIGGRYFVAGNYYGVFRITSGKLSRLTNRDNFAREVDGALATKAGDDMVERLRALRQ